MTSLLLVLALLNPPPPPGTVCYEIFVRSFYDSNGDGIGDVNGLTQKLDYVAGLGARCIWLMPVAESPSYHGYDVTDYYTVEPDYGTNEDFKRFIGEAHARGIKVLVDLVLNHASSEHPFFQQALRDTTSAYRPWFIWSRTPGPRNQYGGDNWHRSPVRDEYYYGFFWSGMPDLNFRHPPVMEEAKRVARFWLEEMGVDGFRLDAVRHLVEDGSIVSNTPGTLAALREFGQYVRRIAPQSFTIGEVWDSTGVLLQYYPDGLDAYFAFEVSDGLIDAVRTGSAGRLLPAIQRLEREVPGRWSSFMRNHDQTRTLTALGGDRAAAKLAATLLLTLPGLPFIYYGEEIGMTGDKPDERLRTPMHWSRARGVGFTRGAAWQALHPDSFTANVEMQEADTGSLLALHRRLIRARAANPALHSGDLVPLITGDSSVIAYVRRSEGRVVLVVANLGTAVKRRVTLSTTEAVLPAGAYAARELFGGARRPGPTIGANGRMMGYMPAPTLGPREAVVIEIQRRD